MASLPTEKHWPCELMRLISESSEEDSWKMVLEYIKTHPSETHCCGALFGQTPLHVACLRYPPMAIVEALCEYAPETASHANKDGETPLHQAVICASEQVQQYLLELAPRTVSLVDKYGDSPLHMAARNGATHSLLQAMVQISPSTISLTNKRGATPFCLLPRSYVEAECIEDLVDDSEFAEDWKAAILFLRAAACCGQNNNKNAAAINNNNNAEQKANALLDEKTTKTGQQQRPRVRPEDTRSSSSTTTVDTTTTNDDGYDDDDEEEEEWNSSFLCHAAAQIPSCPRILLKLLMKFYPHESLEYDYCQKTPLIWACSTPEMEEPIHDEVEDGYRGVVDAAVDFVQQQPEDDHRVDIWAAPAVRRLDHEEQEHQLELEEPNLKQQQQENTALSLIIQWNTSAAKYTDEQGRFPLTLALESGKTWDKGIRQLVWAAPQALATRDVKTHFYPFQLAQDLDTIYNLLRTFPQYAKFALEKIN